LLLLQAGWSEVRVPVGGGNFSLNHRVQNDYGAHPAFSPMGTRGSFPGGKAAGEWSWPLTSIQRRGQECVGLYLRSPNTPSGKTSPLPYLKVSRAKRCSNTSVTYCTVHNFTRHYVGTDTTCSDVASFVWHFDTVWIRIQYQIQSPFCFTQTASSRRQTRSKWVALVIIKLSTYKDENLQSKNFNLNPIEFTFPGNVIFNKLKEVFQISSPTNISLIITQKNDKTMESQIHMHECLMTNYIIKQQNGAESFLTSQQSLG
jgi:hypothetical protein